LNTFTHKKCLALLEVDILGMKLKSIRELKNFKNKRVLLRVDFNVPVEEGKVKDDWRIRAILPTLEFLRKAGAKVVIVSHLGRPIVGANPKSEIRNPKQIQMTKIQNSKLSLRPVFNYLKKLVNFKVDFSDAGIGSPSLERKIKSLKAGGVLMLENIRFYADEEANDAEFAKKLAEMADIFVNDAFAVSHRDCASITGVTKFLPCYAGLNLEKEVEVLSNVFKNPAKPMVVLMGGAKISDKIGVIEKMLPKSKVVLLGGGLANNFLKARGFEIGDSFFDKDGAGAAARLKKNVKIVLPVDVVITNGKRVEIKLVSTPTQPPPPRGRGRNGGGGICPVGWKIVDIGPRTIKLFSDYIRRAQTIVWNGPMGYFEKPEFSYGTMSMAQIVGSRSTGKAFGVVGGGETIEALRKSGMENYIDWVSTGGGAMLEFLEKGTLIGLEPLKK